MSPFIEAHQFKGVWPDPDASALATRELAKPVHQRTIPWNRPDAEDVLRQMLLPPPFDGRVSMYFKNGASFDVQQDNNGRQYLVLPRENKATLHQQVEIGEWICLMPSGKFMKFTDADYKAFGGEPE